MSQKPLSWVILTGSLRKNSSNAAVASALPELAPEGVVISALGSIGEFPLYNADIQEQEGFPPAVTAMAEAIVGADGVIIVSPEYNYSVPGVLKNALDWLSRIKPQPWKGKPVLIQSASTGVLGGSRMQYHLRQILVAVDARVMNTPEVMIGRVQNQLEDGKLVNPDTIAMLTKQLQAFLEFSHGKTE